MAAALAEVSSPRGISDGENLIGARTNESLIAGRCEGARATAGRSERFISKKRRSSSPRCRSA